MNPAQTEARNPTRVATQRRGYLGEGPQDIDAVLGLLRAMVVGLDSTHRPAGERSPRA